MIRRNFLKAICASPLAFLVKKPKAGCSVVDCQSSKVAGSTMCDHHRDFMDALIAGQHRAKQWREYAAKIRMLTTTPRHPNGYAYVVRNETLGDGQVISWMQIPGEARCYVEKS